MSDLEDIVCFEAGSIPEDERWIPLDSIASIADDVDAIRKAAATGLLRIEQQDGFLRVRGNDKVGLILLPSGRRVIIRSKVPSLVLLEWLAYLGEFPPLESWLSDPSIATGEDFHVCIGRLFLRELEKVTRRFLRKDYTPLIAMEARLRGRLLVGRLYRSMHRLPELPQLLRIRTLNTDFNITLALALDRLPILMRDSNPEAWKAMARMRDAWANIEREVGDVTSTVTEAQWACPPGYRSALQLARLILLGAATDPNAGAGGQAFILSLAAIWERSLLRMFADLEESTGWSVLPPSERTRQWDDSIGKEDKSRWMTADVMVERENELWVLDAKYKRAFGDESRSDRFQMCAYAVGFDADRVSLLYPTATEVSFRERPLLQTKVGGRHLRIDSIELPMTHGPNACKASLKQISEACSLQPMTAF